MSKLQPSQHNIMVLIALASNHGLLKDPHNLPNPPQLKICTRVMVQKKDKNLTPTG